MALLQWIVFASTLGFSAGSIMIISVPPIDTVGCYGRLTTFYCESDRNDIVDVQWIINGDTLTDEMAQLRGISVNTNGGNSFLSIIGREANNNISIGCSIIVTSGPPYAESMSALFSLTDVSCSSFFSHRFLTHSTATNLSPDGSWKTTTSTSTSTSCTDTLFQSSTTTPRITPTIFSANSPDGSQATVTTSTPTSIGIGSSAITTNMDLPPQTSSSVQDAVFFINLLIAVIITIVEFFGVVCILLLYFHYKNNRS